MDDLYQLQIIDADTNETPIRDIIHMAAYHASEGIKSKLEEKSYITKYSGMMVDIQHILVEVFENSYDALKFYTPEERSITLNSYIIEEEDKPRLVIKVVDNGTGIEGHYREGHSKKYGDKNTLGGWGEGLVSVYIKVQRNDGKHHLGNREDGNRGTQLTMSFPIMKVNEQES